MSEIVAKGGDLTTRSKDTKAEIAQHVRAYLLYSQGRSVRRFLQQSGSSQIILGSATISPIQDPEPRQ